jgi:hypothetical protein
VTPTPGITPTPTPVTIQFSSATYIEDESQTAAVNITRAGSTQGSFVVTFATASGTATGGVACTSGVDFVNVSQSVIFNPGETVKVVGVPLCPDLLTEPLENATMTLTGANVGPPSTATLNVNDTANQFRNVNEIDFNFGAPAVPYPSTITVSGLPPQFGAMRVTIYDVQHQLPDNMDFLLVSPTGIKYIFMADAGGVSQMTTPATVTFSDISPTAVPNNGPLVTGSFKPVSWEQPQTSFAAPAPPAPYIEPNSSGLPTMQSVFGFANPNGVWSLYARDDNGTFQPEVLSGIIGGGWGLELLQTTAAQASLSGRVTTAEGAGIRNARITIAGDSLPEPLTATTGSFGYFSFNGLRSGQTYVVTVNSQRYTFTVPSRVITLVDNLFDVDFVAEPQGR